MAAPVPSTHEPRLLQTAPLLQLDAVALADSSINGSKANGHHRRAAGAPSSPSSLAPSPVALASLPPSSSRRGAADAGAPHLHASGPTPPTAREHEALADATAQPQQLHHHDAQPAQQEPQPAAAAAGDRELYDEIRACETWQDVLEVVADEAPRMSLYTATQAASRLLATVRASPAGPARTAAQLQAQPAFGTLVAVLAAGVPQMSRAQLCNSLHALAQLRAPLGDALLAAYAQRAQQLVAERAASLRRAADAMQQQLPGLCALLVKEARKTWGDSVSEVREAIDFLRYYASEAERVMAPTALPGPTGESNTLRLEGRGAWVCISPWNFPLAIFIGQVAAALATGNTVLAKPAEQTPAIALAAVKLLHAAGVPTSALELLHGPGETVGAALVAQPGIAGVVFTGSTQVARIIHRALAAKDGPIVPLIAETGGINAMLVDSTALPEQVADAVVQSAFRSAGQRCSALRLLCVHEAIADGVIAMIQGAAKELVVGNPADLATDLGPVIDAEAFDGIGAHLERLHAQGRALLPPSLLSHALPHLIAPQMFEVPAIADVKQEIFGPVLQVVRWGGDPMAVIGQINALGYGLTLGIQTRIDSRAQALAAAARVGNVYVNRNMIGAVVGVQPFGGEGLSGTGPKAGGPNYLMRFCAEQTLTINTTAAGGNVSLFTS